MESDRLRSHLITCAKALALFRGLQTSTVGRLAANDGQFFKRLEGTCTFTVQKYDEVMAWFSENWPEEAEWPEGIPRPVKAAA